MQLNSVYKCALCGNIVEVMHVGGGELVCCGEAMSLCSANTTDAATEKHVPVIEKTQQGIRVTVGSVEHPMGEDHYIEWIEANVDGILHRAFLKPGSKPQVEFPVQGNSMTAYAYCNLHGLWKGE